MKFDPACIQFQIEHRGTHHGQHDWTMFIFDTESYAGHLDYSVFQGQCAIQMIVVSKSLLRQGYATALLQRLQAEFPGSEIAWGLMTNEGAFLRASVPTTLFVDQEMRPRQKKVEEMRVELHAIETAILVYWEKESRDDADHVLQGERMARFNTLQDAIVEHERELALKPARIKLINIPEWVAPMDVEHIASPMM